MYYDDGDKVNQGKSRAEKVREAKAAFEEPVRGNRGRTRAVSSRGMYNSYSSYGNQGYYGDSAEGEEEYLERDRTVPFGMLRMLAAGVLFLALVAAFHYDVSWQGFDKAYVQKQMAEHGHWDALVNQVSAVLHYNDDSINDK